mgnify:FL=1
MTDKHMVKQTYECRQLIRQGYDRAYILGQGYAIGAYNAALKQEAARDPWESA